MGTHTSGHAARKTRSTRKRRGWKHGPLAAVAGAIALLAVVIATAVLTRVPSSDRTIETGALAGYRGPPASASYTPPATVTKTITAPPVTVTAPASSYTAAAPPGTQAPVTPAPAIQPSAAPQASYAPQGSFLAREEAQGNDCVLRVPANPLSARGLATPYQLSNGPNTTGCDFNTAADAANLGAFVQATIIEPGGAVAVYDPLVVTAGTVPAVAPPVPVIPFGSVVGIWTGFNGSILFLTGPGAGFFDTGMAAGTPFGQVAAADAPLFFAVAERTARVPALGTAGDGQACPTTRDFSLVDQDPSDNVTSHYLVTAGGQTAEPGSGAAASFTAANGSDNNLLASFVDPALGCTPFEAPSLSSPGTMSSSQALNELQAARDQQAPVALVPPDDPMTTVGADDDIIAGDFPQAGNLSAFKTDLYRSNVGQQLLFTGLAAAAQTYCNGMQTIGAPRLALDAAMETGPSPAAGMTLAQFMATRFAASISLLNCGLFNPGSTVVAVPGSAQAAAAATPSPTPSVTTTSPSPSDTTTSPAPDVTTTSPAPDATDTTTSPAPDVPATTPASTGP